MKNITLAYSSCPNDTFIFYAIAHKLLKIHKTGVTSKIKPDDIGTKNIVGYKDAINLTDNIEFKITIADVETLNQHAANGFFDVTKLSFATFGVLRDKYALLRTGAAIGRGCGPLLISLPERRMINYSKIAVPGTGTTAFVLFSLFLKENFPQVKPEFIPMPFEKIMRAVKDEIVDFGVIIHEGRFIYKNLGLESFVDLGEWWESFTQLPIPLGCIAIKRSIYQNAPELAVRIQQMIGESIQYGFDHPESGRAYIKIHAQELDDEVINQHIHLYVNNFSKNIGNEGEAAIRIFFQKAEDAGLIKPSTQPIFAC
ncbi:MAG: 1,4-dihydroxy-6-naphthoate synthase [Desulfamplus sp.]|nr:1,4-dihydroxy-6-naphthoate synthase [Desulfamplus sp.]MBF0412187.1 1,4-dihydroxy-6-naphthoate synthase [Desulfamplus sp.]